MDMKEHPRIWIDPERCGGKPCIRGHRVRVVDILEQLADGLTRMEILDCYEQIEDADITAALEFALAVLSVDQTSLTIQNARPVR